MPSRFPHGGEDAPLLAGDSRGRGGNAKKSDSGADRLLSRGVTALAALLLIGLCVMLGVHLMGSYHSADSDLSNKDKSWIETLDDGTKILHGADGKLSIVSGDAGKKSSKHHKKKKGTDDILDLLHNENAKGSIEGEIDPNKDIASQQNDILLNKEKEMMDQLTAMAKGKGGPDAKGSSKKPSVNPAEAAEKMLAGGNAPTTSTFDPRAALRHHEEALEHLSTKDKHANENLKLTDQEKSELEQLEELTRKPPPGPPAYVTPEEQLLHKAAMKAKKHDEKGAEDWYNQLDDSVDVFEVRNQALIELEEASHKKDDKKGAEGVESTKASAKHAAKASAKAKATKPSAEPVASTELEPVASTEPEPVASTEPEPVADKEGEVAKTGEDELEADVELADTEPEPEPEPEPVEPFGAHDSEDEAEMKDKSKKDEDEDEPAAAPIEPFGAHDSEAKNDDEDGPDPAEPIEPFGAHDSKVEAEPEADDDDEPVEPVEPFGHDDEKDAEPVEEKPDAVEEEAEAAEKEEEPEPVAAKAEDPEPAANAEKEEEPEPVAAKEEEPEPAAAAEKEEEPEPVAAADPASAAPASDAGDKHPTPEQIKWWKDHHPNGAALGHRTRNRRPVSRRPRHEAEAALGVAPSNPKASSVPASRWSGVDLAQHLSCSDSLADPATGKTFDVATEFYMSDETTLGPNGEAIKLGPRARAVRDTTFVSAFLRVDGPGAPDPTRYLTGVRHAACNAGRARLNSVFFADSPEMCAHVRRLYDNGRALSNELAPPVPRLGSGKFRCQVKAVKNLPLKPATGLRPEAVIGGCANSANVVRVVQQGQLHGGRRGDVRVGPGRREDESVRVVRRGHRGTRRAQGAPGAPARPRRARRRSQGREGALHVPPQGGPRGPGGGAVPRRRDDGDAARLLGHPPGFARVQAKVGRLHAQVRSAVHAHRRRARAVANGSRLLRRLQEPPERGARRGSETRRGGHRGEHQERRVDVPVPQRGVRHEQAAQRRDVPGGETVQRGKDCHVRDAGGEGQGRGEGAVDGEGRGRGGGDGRAAQARRAGRGWDRFVVFASSRLGVARRRTQDAAALGAEAIESDVPGKRFIDASPDGTDGSCARSEDGTPSGFAELPSMGLISWRFN